MPDSPQRSHRLTIALAASLLLTSAAGVASAASSASSPSAAPSTTALSTGAPATKLLADALPGLSALTDLGALPAVKKMTVGVLLPGNTTALNAYDAAISDKTSPLFGQSLTPEQVEARFGVSRIASTQAQTALEAHGLKATYVARDAEYVSLTGTVAQVEQTFRTSLHAYSALGRTWFANTVGATVPQAVGAVVGLTDMTNVKTADTQDFCDEAGAPTGLCMGTVLSPTYWSAYDMPNTGLTGDLGQGQRIAIFGEGDLGTTLSDLRKLEDATTVGDLAKPVLPHVPVREVLVNDPQVATADTAGTDEWDLDSQSSTGVSPDLSELDFYFGADLSDQTIGAIYSTWVNDDDGPAIGNSSFGGCETLEHISGGEETSDVFMAQAVAEGRTMFVSSGDSGAGGCSVVPVNAGQPGAPGTEDPAASPYVTAVGGTILYTTSTGNGGQAQPPTRNIEYPWTNGGGGYDEFDAQPAVQGKLADTETPRIPCVGNTSATCRTVPDIASMSGDVATNNYAVIIDGADSAVSGTSLSSPASAGMWARVTAAHNPVAGGCTTAGVPDASLAHLGFAQTALYDVAESSTANDTEGFFDVGDVTNKSIPVPNFVYPPLPRSALDPTGYDLDTGLGVMDVAGLTKLLDCGITPVSAAVPANGGLTVVDANSFAYGQNGATCPANGVATDVLGDELPATSPDLDIASAHVTYDATGVTFSTTMAGAQTADTDGFVFIFGYQGTIYGVDDDTSGTNGYGEVGAMPTAGPAYRLFKLQIDQVPNAPLLGNLDAYEEPVFLGNLSGTTNAATGVYTVDLPYASFNADATNDPVTPVTPQTLPSSPLGLGSTISSVEVLSGLEPALGVVAQNVVADTLEFDCPVYLGAAAAGTATVVTSTTHSTAPGTVGAAATAKKTAKKTKAVKKTTIRHVTAPSRTLAFTGSTPLLPALGLVGLLGAGVIVGASRRRSRRDPGR